MLYSERAKRRSRVESPSWSRRACMEACPPTCGFHGICQASSMCLQGDHSKRRRSRHLGPSSPPPPLSHQAGDGDRAADSGRSNGEGAKSAGAEAPRAVPKPSQETVLRQRAESKYSQLGSKSLDSNDLARRMFGGSSHLSSEFGNRTLSARVSGSRGDFKVILTVAAEPRPTHRRCSFCTVLSKHDPEHRLRPGRRRPTQPFGLWRLHSGCAHRR